MKFNLVKSKAKLQAEELTKNLRNLEEQVTEASSFINEIEKGNFKKEISANLSKNELGVSLTSMKAHLDKIALEEQIRNWLNTGLATFSDILRNKQSLNLRDLSDDILLNLVKYVSANQGAIFVLEDDGKGDQYLKLIACYAYNRKKYLEKRIELGEGLAGQCVLEKQSIYLKQTPDDYINITSGLGDAPPRSIFISPLLINDSIFGVIELASLVEFKPEHLDFINKLAENIAASIKTVKDNERTLTLLNASQQQAEELRSQEEEMRQNMEEMQATQEEMKRKGDELSAMSAEMTGVITGINSTMATIEFQPDGTIVTANENFLQAMGYTLDKVKGKHHRLFVPKEILESEEYKTFWTKLASGKAIAGIFKRISSTGSTVWLNAIYNPILNANGDVVKVIKLGTDVTKEKEKEAEMQRAMHEVAAKEVYVTQLLNTSLDSIYTVDKEYKLATWNNSFAATLEKFGMQVTKGTDTLVWYPTDEERKNQILLYNRVFNGESFDITISYEQEGKTYHQRSQYAPIKNDKNQIVEAVIYMNDITQIIESQKKTEQLMKEAQSQAEELKAQEEELRQNMEELATTQEEINRRQKESEALLQRFELSAETTSDGLWDMVVPETLEFTNETPFIWTNKFRSMLGYKNEIDFPNILSSWSDLLHPDHKQITLDAFTAHLMDFSGKTPYNVEYKLKLNNGTYKWFRAVGKTLRDEKGKPMRVAGSLIDIQATKDLEQIRKDVVERFELTSSASTEGLWDMTVPENLEFKDDTAFSWTPKFREMLGYKNETDFPNILASWSDLLHPDHKQKTLEAFTAHLIDFSGKTPYDVEYKLKLKTGDYKWFRAVGKTMRDVNGKPLRVAGALIDIQAIKELEELKKSKKS